jgi:hypothetical protein
MNPAILMPDIVLNDFLVCVIQVIREDLKDNVGNDEKTILYKLLGETENGKPLKLNNYNFFVQAKKIFEREDNLTINFGYAMKVAKMVALHIILPSENSTQTIGSDEGYLEKDYEPEQQVGGKPFFTATYDTNYQIMITSDNSSEVNLVYNILKSILLMFTPQLEFLGLRLPKVGGNDIVFQDDVVPPHIFHKVINLSFFYELTVPKPVVDGLIGKIIFKLHAIDYFKNT